MKEQSDNDAPDWLAEAEKSGMSKAEAAIERMEQAQADATQALRDIGTTLRREIERRTHGD